jgi:hypothetical protein
LTPDQMAKFRAQLITNPHVYAIFSSPTNTGLKVWIRVEADAAQHAANFDAVQALIRAMCGVDIDTSCKDVARLCFVILDPDAFLNRDAMVLAPLLKATKAEIVGERWITQDVEGVAGIWTEAVSRAHAKCAVNQKWGAEADTTLKRRGRCELQFAVRTLHCGSDCVLKFSWNSILLAAKGLSHRKGR